MAIINGDDGDNFLFGTDDPDTILGGDGNDTILALDGGDTVDGGPGNDVIDADGANDTLYGGSGDDLIEAGDGDDLLDGGSGDDALTGGSGDDTYVFGPGYGHDVVNDSSGADRVQFVDGVAPTDVGIARDGNDLLVTLPATGDTLRLTGWFLADPSARIETFVFGDGTMFDATTIADMVDNEAPTAQSDSATVSEDATSPVTGTVLGNDTDVETAARLSVTNAGEYQLQYGKLTINADGTYSYALDSSLAEVQALAAGESLVETFEYHVTDGGLNAMGASAQLAITIQGADEASPQGRTIIGTNRNDRLFGTDGDDTIDGRKGFDEMIGGNGDDVYYVDASHGRGGRGHWSHWWDCGRGRRGKPRADQVVERANEGWDTVYSSGSYILPVNVEALHLLGSKSIDGTGNAHANWLEGNKGNNALDGGAGDDLLQGGKGNDELKGGRGVDVLQGGKGNDELKDKDGSTVFDGGAGSDDMEGGRSADFFAGGDGNDELELGGGRDVIAFNKGDGVDRIEGECQDGVLSLGGGIRYEDLRFRKDGKDLVLETGGSDRLVFEDWYKGNKSVVTLQMVTAAMQGFDTNSRDDLRNDRVELFNFQKLVAAFDDALKSKKNMDSWNLMNGLLAAHLGGSDDAALGGDLAYRYGMTGSLEGMGWDAAQDTVAAAGFGQHKQTLQLGAQDEAIKLGS